MVRSEGSKKDERVQNVDDGDKISLIFSRKMYLVFTASIFKQFTIVERHQVEVFYTAFHPER